MWSTEEPCVRENWLSGCELIEMCEGGQGKVRFGIWDGFDADFFLCGWHAQDLCGAKEYKLVEVEHCLALSCVRYR